MHDARIARPLLPLALGLLLLGACGGGGAGPGDGAPPVAPAVIAFSPTVVPFDFTAGTQAPRFTNETLTLNTDPAYPGKAVVYFDPAAPLDESSFYPGGRPELGIDLDALRWIRFIAGTGWVPVDLDEVDVQPDRVVLTPRAPGGGPAATIATGQYTFVVGAAVRATNGLPIAPAPVYHTFFVGSDPTGPYLRESTPEPDAFVPASELDIVLTMGEGIDGTSLDATSVHVEHLGALAVTTLQAVPGFPRLQVEMDGTTLPTNGHVIVWRARDPFPTSGSIRVTVGNGPVLGGMDLLDLNGLAVPTPQAFQFRATP